MSSLAISVEISSDTVQSTTGSAPVLLHMKVVGNVTRTSRLVAMAPLMRVSFVGALTLTITLWSKEAAGQRMVLHLSS